LFAGKSIEEQKMSGYPGGGYPGNQGGYPGGGAAPPPSGYPGAPNAPSGGYPGAPQQQGGYPGTAPQSGYGAAPPPAQNNYSGTGGYGQQPAVDPSVAQWFSAVDTDRSGQISAQELQRALVNGNWSHFSEEACRMMIDMYDKNASGSIDVNEFQLLFSAINQWKGVFQGYDKDKSGTIEQSELSQAFQQMGYRFTPTFVQNLLAKYDSRTRRLTLDNFIVACVQIKRLTDGFRTRDRAMQGQATLQYEDFVGLAMGVHQ